MHTAFGHLLDTQLVGVLLAVAELKSVRKDGSTQTNLEAESLFNASKAMSSTDEKKILLTPGLDCHCSEISTLESSPTPRLFSHLAEAYSTLKKIFRECLMQTSRSANQFANCQIGNQHVLKYHEAKRELQDDLNPAFINALQLVLDTLEDAFAVLEKAAPDDVSKISLIKCSAKSSIAGTG